MTTIPQLSQELQSLFTEIADEKAKRTGFITRQRDVTGNGFAQGLVFGWAHQPQATSKQLHESVLETGIDITPQALDQRFAPAATAFMQELLEEALRLLVRSHNQRPILSRFNGVYLTDSTQVTWGEKKSSLAYASTCKEGD